MKKLLTLIFSCLLTANVLQAQYNFGGGDFFNSTAIAYFLQRDITNYDFTDVCESGQTLGYKFIYQVTLEIDGQEYTDYLLDPDKIDIAKFDTGLVVVAVPGDQNCDTLVLSATATHEGKTYPVWFMGNLEGSAEHFRNHQCISLTLPSSLLAIAYNTMPWLSGYSSYRQQGSRLNVPKSLKAISRYNFESNSSKPDTLAYEGTLRDWLNIFFFDATSCPVGDNTVLYFNGSLMPTDIVIPEGVTTIKRFAFYNFRKIKSVTFPTSLTKIQNDAFNLCESLTAVELPEALEILEAGAFRDCKSLTSVILPESVISIDQDAFTGCPRLATVICKAPITPEVKDNTFGNYNASLYVPDEYLHLYRGHAIWGSFREVIPFSQAPNHVKQLLHETTSKTAIVNVEQSNIAIAAQDNSIVVKNAENTNISIFDVMGRTIVDQQPINHNDETIALPQRGMYIVRIGNNYSKKVFVK